MAASSPSMRGNASAGGATGPGRAPGCRVGGRSISTGIASAATGIAVAVGTTPLIQVPQPHRRLPPTGTGIPMPHLGQVTLTVSGFMQDDLAGKTLTTTPTKGPKRRLSSDRGGRNARFLIIAVPGK